MFSSLIISGSGIPRSATTDSIQNILTGESYFSSSYLVGECDEVSQMFRHNLFKHTL